MQNINKLFNNADSFSMAFDEAWQTNEWASHKDLTEDQKMKKVLDLVKDHPFAQSSYDQAKKVAAFRVRLLKLK